MNPIRINPGDPIVDQLGRRVIARFRKGFALEPGATAFNWTWHNPKPGDLTPPATIATPGGPIYRNQGTVHLDYSAAGIQVWRASYLFGDVEHAFACEWFMDAEPRPGLASLAAACELLAGKGHFTPGTDQEVADMGRRWAFMAQKEAAA